MCLFSLWAVSQGWQNPLLDFHKFRQTQTAISTYYMLGKAPSLAYEVPVLGEPWAAPMEFPVFQWAVAAIVTLFGTALDQTGRFVSCFFFFWREYCSRYFVISSLSLSTAFQL